MAINEAETPGNRDEGMNAEALQAQERPVGWSLLDCRSCITMFVARFLFALPLSSPRYIFASKFASDSISPS